MSFIKEKTLEGHFSITLLVMGIIFIFFGIVLSPDLLLFFGFFRHTLVLNDEYVIQNTLLEIKIWKILAIALDLFFLLMYLLRRRIIASTFFKNIKMEASLPFQKTNGVFSRSFYIFLPIMVLAILYVSFGKQILPDETLRKINREDGWIESLSAILFFITCLISTITALKTGNKSQKRIFYVLGILFLFIAGEEISWGQRIFNMETISAIKESNVQGENNLHNLFGYFFDHAYITGVFVWGFVIPFFCRINLFAKGFFNYIKIPVASQGLAIFFFILTLFQNSIVHRVLEPLPYLRNAELREFLSSIAFLLLISESRTWLKDTSIPVFKDVDIEKRHQISA